ncbi:hypothetical protein PMAYCL1PPCAC_05582 [Pristionchus mayeri]|uniref:Cationic amino acid transporter C-terminal domain-containing protein n=1 Tax=Pristionchus mayeri TaxID=1317129 RepID=A0AAN5C364_9BILA|nr:hypothetical protein PMAYCL1PPCAC_05582 [Pristionchus mayeri]
MNFQVILFVIGYGMTFANFSYWKNFFPCGINGVLAGASKCFFAYVGFDGLATAGEEAKDPAKMIPRATFWSMGLAITCYVGMSGALSLMMPYYELPASAVYATVFIKLGAPDWISIVISIGCLIGILTSITNGLYSLPRAIYAMAEDGLIFGWWAKVNPRTKTPINATITATILVAIIGMTFDIEALIDFLSIGTLLAYSMVNAALIILRYRPQPLKGDLEQMDQGGTIRPNIPILSKMFEHKKEAGNAILFSIIMMVAGFSGVGVLINTTYYKTAIGTGLMVLSILVSIGSILFIDAHHQNSMELDYKVFAVPYVPAASLLFNVLMMTQLTILTWIRLAVWMAIGAAIYLGYGISHSKEEQLWKEARGAIKETKVKIFRKKYPALC